MKPKRFAAYSQSPIANTRMEIEKLLSKWGCKKVGFFDHYDEQRVEIQFVWLADDGIPYAGRFVLDVRPCKLSELGASKIDAEVRGRWRALLYFLRSALGAVEAGIIEAEALFLPWLLQGNGQTVSEALLPRLRELQAGNAAMLLGAGPTP